jgi:arylsulfatase A-like enzyme
VSRGAPRRGASPALDICCTAAVLGLLLLVLRARVVFTRSDLRDPVAMLRRFPSVAFPDLAYVAGLAVAGLALCALAAGRSRLQRAIAGAFALLACLSLVFGFVNVRAVAELGRPMNYQWLYYSHFMRSMDSYTALAALLSWTWAATVTAACLLLLIGAGLLARGARRVGWPGVPAWAAGAALLACLGLGWSRGGPREWSDAQAANPVLTLAASAFEAGRNPVLARMVTPIGPEDFLTAGERAATAGVTPLSGRARAAGVRNVVVVVLESVGAQYLWGFGGRDRGLMPELENLSGSGRRFVSFYAHQPSTTHSLVALLLAVYPPHSFRVLTREHPDIALPSLSSELKRRGYRTAFINAEDVGFQRADEFLAHQRFDLISDASTGACPAASGSARRYDDCMVAKLGSWIASDSTRPFFAVLCTYQTHFPYLPDSSATSHLHPPVPVTPGLQQPESLDVRFNRYRGGLRATDRALGTLVRDLEARGQLESTLIVLIGEHGEAFGQHGNAFHRYLFEEEVRVPFLLINPRLFHGEVDSVAGGTIDVAPTVLDLLGQPLPAEWQGRSLFAAGRTGRVYLFGPYSGLFGLREGSRKLIYDAIADRSSLYDLAADPLEAVDIAPADPAVVEQGKQRLAAWVQYQRRFYVRHGVSP